MMKTVFADLHIHIGRTEAGKPVKISGSRDLTFHNIAHEASVRKGIELVGIIDCHAPGVQEDIRSYLEQGMMAELPGGGIRYRNTTVLLGCEIEVRDSGMQEAHMLVFMPDFQSMRAFTAWIGKHMKNVELSSQRIRVPARELQAKTASLGGIFIPAHIFTPHKGMYGSVVSRMEQLLDPVFVSAVELGLSADTLMASHISELDNFPFLTNSDAHSLAKIGREYNRLRVREANFEEFVLALKGEGGRGIEANYGLNPRLGKYHRTYCADCDSILDEASISEIRCMYCGSTKIVRGVMDRILAIADRPEPRISETRPPYYYQVPLEFIPGLGPRKREALLAKFGTEMNVLHFIAEEQLAEVVGMECARHIVSAREGHVEIAAGGGGHYGKIAKKQSRQA